MEKFTLTEYAEMMRTNKPYLIAIEEMVNSTEYGDLHLVLNVRANQVEKMTVVQEKTWLRPKEGHRQQFINVTAVAVGTI